MRTTLSPSAPLGAGLGDRLRRGALEALRAVGAGLSRALNATIEARYRDADREIARVMRLNSSIPDEIRQAYLQNPRFRG